MRYVPIFSEPNFVLRNLCNVSGGPDLTSMTASEFALFAANTSTETNSIDQAPDDSTNTIIHDLGNSSGSDVDLGVGQSL